MKEFWNERYTNTDFIYGRDPNTFFTSILDNLTPGRILLPMDGDGRNSVYAAKQGWQTESFDFSEVAQKKALAYAESQGIQITYHITDFTAAEFTPASYDVIALLYTHLSPDIRKTCYQKLIPALKPGGQVIFEAFSKQQLGLSSGGPQDPDWLFSTQEMKDIFPNLTMLQLEEKHITLDESDVHRGPAWVVKMVGRK